MEPFTQHTGRMAVIDRANIDTDAIIPKQFLKSIQRTGFGPQLFFDWRYGPDGQPDPEFILNQPAFRGASILVARNNFGCGSSREHAVWAIQQDGFRVVVAPARGSGDSHVPAFADIFRNNSGKCGLLTIELTEVEVEKIFTDVAQKPDTQATANLEAQTLTLHSDPEQVFTFSMDPSVRHKMLLGLDDIALTLQMDEAISAFEARHESYLPTGEG